MTPRARLADTINAAASVARLQTYLVLLRILKIRIGAQTARDSNGCATA